MNEFHALGETVLSLYAFAFKNCCVLDAEELKAIASTVGIICEICISNRWESIPQEEKPCCLALLEADESLGRLLRTLKDQEEAKTSGQSL